MTEERKDITTLPFPVLFHLQTIFLMLNYKTRCAAALSCKNHNCNRMPEQHNPDSWAVAPEVNRTKAEVYSIPKSPVKLPITGHAVLPDKNLSAATGQKELLFSQIENVKLRHLCYKTEEIVKDFIQQQHSMQLPSWCAGRPEIWSSTSVLVTLILC